MTHDLAVIGCGRAARRHLRAVRHLAPRLRLAALVDARPACATELLKDVGWRGPAPSVYASLDELLDARIRGEAVVDIAAITTPSGSHFSLARRCLADGHLHLLLEKPMTLDLGEARELAVLADRLDLRVALGHIYRYFPFVDRICREIASGEAGRILNAQVLVRWGHDQAYYDAAAWRGSWAADGGVLMNQTIHALDLMYWLLGERILRASCQIRRLGHRMEAEDLGLALLELEGGGLLHVEGTTNSSPKRHLASFYILCEKRSYSAGIDRGRPLLEVTDHEGRPLTRRYYAAFLKQLLRDGPRFTLQRTLNPHSAIYDDLLDAIETGGRPRADAAAGVASVEHILALYRSARDSGRPVELPLESASLAEMTGFFAPQEHE